MNPTMEEYLKLKEENEKLKNEVGELEQQYKIEVNELLEVNDKLKQEVGELEEQIQIRVKFAHATFKHMEAENEKLKAQLKDK
jgi:septation ring formation regulator EzrA